MYQATRTVLGGILLTAVAACSGGGGSGDSGPSLVEITSANAKTIAGAVLVSSLEGGDLSGLSPTEIAGSGEAAKPAASLSTAKASAVQPSAAKLSTAKVYAKVQSLEGAEADALIDQSRSGDLQAAVGPESTACMAGGTVTLSGNLSNLVTLTVGDTLTLDFANCDDGTSVIDGAFSMKITSLSGDLTSGMFVLGVDVTVTALRITENGETVTANGSISFVTDSTQSPIVTTTVTANTLTVTGAGATNTLRDFSSTEVVDSVTTEYSLSSHGTLTSTAFSGSVTFETNASFQGTGDDHPVSGEIVITGAKGGSIDLVVLDGVSVRLNLDLNGDGQIDETSDATWDELT
ncbi:MAG TPA: hypothetical protein VFV10_16920 [Gammaproteobacteria bacterium]|nr:hypothetical protein [Gammaproteobacteria bacterium]